MKRTCNRSILLLATCVPLALAGCSQIDPLTAPYKWHPTNVNAANIAAMAANPADLVRGRSSTRRLSVMDSDAVDRVWTNKPTALSGGSSGGGSGGASGGGAAPSGGGT
jgi:type IV pilus biogenesis protein CpaD/CtpE